MNKGFRLNLFWKCVIFYCVVYYGGLRVLFPLISQWAVDAPAQLPMPGAALAMYRILILAGLFVYIAASNQLRREFLEPLFGFFAFSGAGPRGLVRKAVLVAVPLAVGAVVFNNGIPRLISPAGVRIQHPTMPGSFENLTNPFRNPTAEQVRAYQKRLAEEDEPIAEMAAARQALVKSYTAEGAALYAINCRPCHGMQANGAGPMARGFRLKPANFRDPGLLPTIIESYAFWRVSKGGPGLPSASTPWDSAMPVWGQELSEEDRWKVLLGEYFIAGVGPREPEKQE